MNTKRTLATLATVGVLALGVSPAFDYTHDVRSAGARAFNSTTTTLAVSDLKADNQSVHGEANNTTNRLDNNSGSGTTVYKNLGVTITAVRACVNVKLGVDTCTSWK